LAPGAGAILAAIEAATDVHPLVIGKPERAMFDVALELLASNPENTAVLGDRLDTDIEGARRSGLLSLLVLTGVTTAEMLEHTEIRPDLVFGDLIELVDVWQKYLQTY
jgi:4-nitrophenyl phosphatase